MGGIFGDVYIAFLVGIDMMLKEKEKKEIINENR
jgi:hypothetical protein